MMCPSFERPKPAVGDSRRESCQRWLVRGGAGMWALEGCCVVLRAIGLLQTHVGVGYWFLRTG